MVDDEEKEDEDEEEDEDKDVDMDEDKDKNKDDEEYEEQNLFIVPPQPSADMSDDDTSEGYKESADELEGDTMSEE